MAVSDDKLKAAESELAVTRQQIDDQRDRMAELEGQLARIALQQYQDRGLNTTAMLMASSSSDDLLGYITAMQQVSDTANSLFTGLQLEQGKLTNLERVEQATVTSIQQEKDKLKTMEAEAREQVATAAGLLDRMTTVTMTRVAPPGGLNSEGRGVSDPWKVVPNPSAKLISPLAHYTMTDAYGMRIHPISGGWIFHDGMDMASGCGSPITAPANGFVTDYYWAGGYGNRLVIDHGIVGGHHIVTSFNHLSSGVAKPGTSVVQGQVVAREGTTGNSTGCHLHYMVWVDGRTVDPAGYV